MSTQGSLRHSAKGQVRALILCCDDRDRVLGRAQALKDVTPPPAAPPPYANNPVPYGIIPVCYGLANLAATPAMPHASAMIFMQSSVRSVWCDICFWCRAGPHVSWRTVPNGISDGLHAVPSATGLLLSFAAELRSIRLYGS